MGRDRARFPLVHLSRELGYQMTRTRLEKNNGEDKCLADEENDGEIEAQGAGVCFDELKESRSREDAR